LESYLSQVTSSNGKHEKLPVLGHSWGEDRDISVTETIGRGGAAFRSGDSEETWVSSNARGEYEN
jgi:hypothetical protein